MPKPEYSNNLQVITDHKNQVEEVSFNPRSMSRRSLKAIFVSQINSIEPKAILITMPNAEVFVSKSKLNQIKNMDPKRQRTEIKKHVRWMACSDEVSLTNTNYK